MRERERAERERREGEGEGERERENPFYTMTFTRTILVLLCYDKGSASIAPVIFIVVTLLMLKRPIMWLTVSLSPAI